MQRSQRSKTKPHLSAVQAYKLARESGNRGRIWDEEHEGDDGKIYDEVSQEQWKHVVSKRMDEPDFVIEDGDGDSGYIDRGVDEDHDMDEPSDDDTRKKQKKKAKAPPKRPAKPPPPEPTVNAYRPKVDPAIEEDFMENLLSGLDTAARAPVPTARPSRKRKQSLDSDDLGSYRDYGGFAGSDASSDGGAYTDDITPFSPAKRAKTARGRGGLARSALKAESASPPPAASRDEDDYGGGDFDYGGIDDDALANFQIDPAKVKLEEEDIDMGDFSLDGPKPKPKPKPAPAPTPVPAVTASASKPIVAAAAATKKPDGPPSWLNVHASLPIAEIDSLESNRSGATGSTDAKTFEDDGSFRFYWLDYYEADGNVHFIGKCVDRAAKGAANKWLSCCVTVKGLERNLFVLPRETNLETDEPVKDMELYQEFNGLRKIANVTKYKSKFVERRYAFGEKDVPTDMHRWLKVSYGFDQPAFDPRNSELQNNITQSSTIARIFGTNTSAFELLVLKRKIKGPCWLNIKEPKMSESKISWTDLEIVVDKRKDINPFAGDAGGPTEVPPLNVMSLNIRTIPNHQTNQSEIICASARLWANLSVDEQRPASEIPSAVHTFIRPLETNKWPAGFEAEAHKTTGDKGVPVTPITICSNEFNLLSKLLVLIQKSDPDVIVGHDFVGVQLDVLLHRIKVLKSANWSRIGRFVRKQLPTYGKQGMNLRFMGGRLVCDIASDGAKSMITSTTWSMTEMCSTHLGVEREDIEPDDVHSYLDPTSSSANRLMHFVRHTELDAFLQMAIASKVQILTLTKELTNLAGNAWNKTLNGGRAERNEYILLHAFHTEKFVLPDKMYGKKAAAVVKAEAEEGDQGVVVTTRGRRDKYKGGLVFEPKKGLWTTYIIVMDFNSLYPSIIREYNIDFTTVDIAEHMASDEPPSPPERDSKPGFLPQLIANYVRSRQDVKRLMKDPRITETKRKQYDIRQTALKLTANSMYGCLGFEYSRFYARPLAALTTQLGRDTLTRTRELAEEMGLDVVYGDTDSVFVNSNKTTIAEARQIADEFKKAVNKQYTLLEIDLDGVFQRLLLLQKKKYAALKADGTDASLKTSKEVKGLDMKRREYCELSKDASNFVLDQVLSGESTDVVVDNIHNYLTQLSEDIRAGKIPVDKFRINKRLGKDPNDYPDKKSQPHVQVALRMREKQQTVRIGQVIPYIFCIGSSDEKSDVKLTQAERAKHPDELRRSEGTLVIDHEFYLSNQILPPIERLCDPIEGTDRARLAECLGLDVRRYQVTTATETEERAFGTLESQIPDAERFKECIPFSVRCRHCKASFAFSSLVTAVESETKTSIFGANGAACPGCKTQLGIPSMQVQLENFIRQRINEFYKGRTICQDPICGKQTRMVGVYGRRCLSETCQGTVVPKYSDLKLYTQLSYLRSLFDAERALSKVKADGRTNLLLIIDANKVALSDMCATVDRFMNMCGRRWVDMTDLFGFMKLS